MPFTASHAAVAAPLARCGLIPSAVAVGAMAPDFEYFLRLSLVSRWGHAWPGMLLFTWPCSLAALWLFHAILKRPLLAFLPPGHRRRLLPYAGPFAFGPPRRFLLILLSLLAGILTHVFLDAFTHVHGPVVERVALLRMSVAVTPHLAPPAYWLLQCAASVVGLLLLGIQHTRWRRPGLPVPLPPCQRWPDRSLLMPLAGFIGLAALLGVFHARTCVPHITGLQSLRLFGGQAFVAGGAALMLEMIGFCALLNRQLRSSAVELAPEPPAPESKHAD
jgi:hypothetical protein